jgi:hypothetical protein
MFHTIIARTEYISMKGFLSTDCNKKRGAVEISYRQFVYLNTLGSKGRKIATSSLCAIAVSLFNHNFI